MKKVFRLPLIMLIALTALLAVSVFGLSQQTAANADSLCAYSDYLYTFSFEDFDVKYDISSNREIAVTETITVKFTGPESTGFIKDIPVNGGEMVKNVSVSELSGGALTYVYYDVYMEENDFVSVDIGDSSRKTGQTHTYVISYDYCLTKAQEGKDALYLNVVGVARNSTINNASVTLILPSGYISSKCYVGSSGSDNQVDLVTENLENGRTQLSLSDIRIPAYTGVTVEMQFESGSLSLYTDYTPYLFLIAGLVILAVIVLLRLFVFNKNYLTPVVNYEAPNKMDPLKMGKLIDNKVDGEDVTSLIFYWASKGYIKINLDDKNDPTLIRIMNTLPEPCPAYEKLMYSKLFAGGDTVKTSSLKYKFYSVVQQVTNMVNKQNSNLYDRKSTVLALIFSILGGLLLGIAPMVIAFLQISKSFLFFIGFIGIIPSICIYVAALALKYNKLKLTKSKFALASFAIVLLCAVVCLIYTLIIPSAIIGTTAKIVLCAASCLIFILSVVLVSRTQQYTEHLNDILGFKEFITLAEKDQLEMMLETDPQFYYNVLPYAQVLGVTSIWEKKFANITVEPPRWLTGHAAATYLEFRMMNSIIIGSMTKMSSSMISRPSSSGRSGSGGFHGGHVGGGHGGGGFRGR